MKHLDLHKARKVYSEGGNVTEFLRTEFQEDENTSEIIEMAYDLQAGSYIAGVNANRAKVEQYVGELAQHLEPHLQGQSSLLDVGSGELTTLSLLLNKLNTQISQVFALDISWSRLHKGKEFFRTNCQAQNMTLTPFVADIKRIPFATKSIDVVTSNHALEPNGKNLPALLTEIFRVTKTKCVLFEPSYELNSKEGQRRMERLGYIKDIEGTVSRLGGRVLDIQLMQTTANPLNPTACFVIQPPEGDPADTLKAPHFSVPGTDFMLQKEDPFFKSAETGLVFPILKDIPILKGEYGILGTALFED